MGEIIIVSTISEHIQIFEHRPSPDEISAFI